MRVKTPAPFSLAMDGPEGTYNLHFVPHDDCDGEIAVMIGGHAMVWQVLTVDLEDGRLILGGGTDGSDLLWPTQYWFNLTLDGVKTQIEYWGDQILWRTDTGGPYTGTVPSGGDAQGRR